MVAQIVVVLVLSLHRKATTICMAHALCLGRASVVSSVGSSDSWPSGKRQGRQGKAGEAEMAGETGEGRRGREGRSVATLSASTQRKAKPLVLHCQKNVRFSTASPTQLHSGHDTPQKTRRAGYPAFGRSEGAPPKTGASVGSPLD